MDPVLISVRGPQMRRFLLFYFREHGQPNPDPGDLACLTAIGVMQIDRFNMGFRPTSYIGMASLLVPAFLQPDHRLHGEISAAVQACKGQFPVGDTAIAATSSTARVMGSLAETVQLRAAAKLPLLGKSARTLAKTMAAKATRSRATAPKKRGPR